MRNSGRCTMSNPVFVLVLVCYISVASDAGVLKRAMKLRRVIRSEIGMNTGDIGITTTVRERDLTTRSEIDESSAKSLGCKDSPSVPEGAITMTCRRNYTWAECKAYCKNWMVFPNGKYEAIALCSNGSWSPAMPPSCIGMEDPSFPENAEYTVGCYYFPPRPRRTYRMTCKPNFFTFMECTVYCDPGRAFPNGRDEASAVCKNGSWVPPMPPMCIDRELLSLPQNPEFTESCSNLPPDPKDTVYMRCCFDSRTAECIATCRDKKYFPDGSSEARALCVDGHWLSVMPPGCS